MFALGAGMVKKSFPLSQVYRLLEPGPAVMVTTVRNGRANIMTMSWHTMIEFEPPTVGCVISDRNHTFGSLNPSAFCARLCPPRYAFAPRQVRTAQVVTQRFFGRWIHAIADTDYISQF